ncbi:polyprenyl synthetase family protein [Alloscardovia omnicolens]|uniref:polyprenyl synthetase family protein n=1 Tax=Alloscardovia omnicolens TaxID=419015 RepID=UPI003A744155
MKELTQHDVDNRLESLVSRAWEHNARHFPHISAPDVLALLAAVGHQGVNSSRGGKRLRALLLHATATTFSPHCELSQEDNRALIDLGCAIEIFQTAALIHDDIIDAADTRRGQLSAHRALEDFTHDADQGSALALMLGDLLATLSIRTAHTSSASLPESSGIFETFLDMHDQVELGQIMDISMETLDLEKTEELASSITSTYINKTASYTTIAPLIMGILASGQPQAAELATTFAHSVGEKLGIAFQIHDDLLDLLDTSESTGKPVGGDIREAKRTYVLAHALRLASPQDRRFLIDAYMQQEPRTADDIARIRSIFMHSGAIESCIQDVEKLWSQAAQEILSTCMTLNIAPQTVQNYLSLCSRFVG